MSGSGANAGSLGSLARARCSSAVRRPSWAAAFQYEPIGFRTAAERLAAGRARGRTCGDRAPVAGRVPPGDPLVVTASARAARAPSRCPGWARAPGGSPAMVGSALRRWYSSAPATVGTWSKPVRSPRNRPISKSGLIPGSRRRKTLRMSRSSNMTAELLCSFLPRMTSSGVPDGPRASLNFGVRIARISPDCPRIVPLLGDGVEQGLADLGIGHAVVEQAIAARAVEPRDDPAGCLARRAARPPGRRPDGRARSTCRTGRRGIAARRARTRCPSGNACGWTASTIRVESSSAGLAREPALSLEELRQRLALRAPPGHLPPADSPSPVPRAVPSWSMAPTTIGKPARPSTRRGTARRASPPGIRSNNRNLVRS